MTGLPELVTRFDLDPPERSLLREARLLDCGSLRDAPGPIRAALVDARDRLRSAVEPRGALLRLGADHAAVAFLRGRDLVARDLARAHGVALFCATLGDAPGRLLERRRSDGLAAFLLHAAANALVEHLVDQLEGLLARRARRDGLSLTRRVSPGYGDLPLAAQADFSRLLDLPALGVAVTPAFLLEPAKSVTAVAFLVASDGPGGDDQDSARQADPGRV